MSLINEVSSKLSFKIQDSEKNCIEAIRCLKDHFKADAVLIVSNKRRGTSLEMKVSSIKIRALSTFLSEISPFSSSNELFSSGKVNYFGQTIHVIAMALVTRTIDSPSTLYLVKCSEPFDEVTCHTTQKDLGIFLQLMSNQFTRRFTSEDVNYRVPFESNLLSRISHEVRTPLNAIQGILLSANDRLSKIALLEKVDIAKINLSLLTKTVEEITIYNNLRNDHFSLQSKPFSLDSLVKKLIRRYQPRFKEKNIEFNHFLNIVPDAVRGDETRITQVLTNLLDNALKFTYFGKVELKISTGLRGNSIVLFGSVKDTGIGISVKDLEELFKPLKQTTSLQNLVGSGLGLGLATTKILCEKMRGFCIAESEFGRGSVFHFELRIDKEIQEPCLTTDTISKQIQQNENLHVLVVDDIDINRLVIALLLDEIGIESDHAEHGEQALSQLLHRQYDIILMDCNMPIMDGFEATRHIRATYGDTSKIVAVTADTTVQNERKCYEAGMDKVITKPINREMLSEIINEYFPKQHTSRK